jgi:hypothetical protein
LGRYLFYRKGDRHSMPLQTMAQRRVAVAAISMCLTRVLDAERCYRAKAQYDQHYESERLVGVLEDAICILDEI